MAKDNSFKKRLNKIIIGTILVVLSLASIVVFTIISIQKNVTKSREVSESLNKVIECQSNVRSFLLNAWSDTIFVKTGSNKDFETFKTNASAFEISMNKLIESMDSKKAYEITIKIKEFESLKKNFFQIATLIKERGYKDLGLEGSLREAAHKLEKSESIADKKTILTLRKNEKDFFLRKDLGYILKFDKEKEKLFEEINSISNSTNKEEMLVEANNYIENFHKIVTLEKEIGLNYEAGLRGEINNSAKNILTYLKETNEQYATKMQSQIIQVIIFIIGTFITLLVIILIALNKLIKPVFEPMQNIQEKAGKISQGELSVSFDDISNNIVMKDLILGFENIIHKFKNTMELVEGISSREIKEEIILNSANDEVSKTLNKIIKQVREIDEEEDKRNWHNEGLAKFAQTLRDTGKNSDILYDSIISELVKYLKANQGALFLLEGEENNDEHLELKGCYAYNRKKFLNMRIEHGEGLTGTCWAEGESIYLTEVPSNYIHISSGLGDARPDNVVLVPIKLNDKVFGVIEIASFGGLETHKIKFIEVLSESIGSVINANKINTKTLQLLQRSQEMTEELRAQEEEMRQNMEEMQATQEEMERMVNKI